MRLAGGQRHELPWRYALAGAVMLGGPVWAELFANHYPARPELFVFPMVAAALGAIVAVGSWLAGGFLGTIIFGGLLFIFVDLQFDLHRWTYTAVLLGGCLVVAHLLVRHRATIVSIALGAFYLASMVRSPVSQTTGEATRQANRSTSPLLLHVILDEQWGAGGLRAAGDTATADFLSDFYLQRGFEVFEGAYSRYEDTESSIPYALSLGRPLSFNDRRTTNRTDYERSIRHNPYFQRLRSLGYDIRVFQTTYLDFCSEADVAPPASCDVQSRNSIGNIGSLEGSWKTRALWIARFFLSTRSHVYARLNAEPSVWRRSVSGGGIAALRRLADAIAAGRPGPTAYFVHVLIPHRPIHADADCRVLVDPSRRIGYEYPTHPTDSLWRIALGAYGGQVRCAHSLLADVIDAVDQAAGRANSIVIVHGDHGSRMHPRPPVRPSLDAYTLAELNETYSTLLAVRRPNVAPVAHGNAIPLQDAIWELARSGFAGTLQEEWHHELRQSPGDDRQAFVRSLPDSDMLWTRRPD